VVNICTVGSTLSINTGGVISFSMTVSTILAYTVVFFKITMHVIMNVVCRVVIIIIIISSSMIIIGYGFHVFNLIFFPIRPQPSPYHPFLLFIMMIDY
jgi:hypothetical protein